jgi:hypothetical protein
VGSVRQRRISRRAGALPAGSSVESAHGRSNSVESECRGARGGHAGGAGGNRHSRSAIQLQPARRTERLACRRSRGDQRPCKQYCEESVNRFWRWRRGSSFAAAPGHASSVGSPIGSGVPEPREADG